RVEERLERAPQRLPLVLERRLRGAAVLLELRRRVVERRVEPRECAYAVSAVGLGRREALVEIALLVGADLEACRLGVIDRLLRLVDLVRHVGPLRRERLALRARPADRLLRRRRRAPRLVEPLLQRRDLGAAVRDLCDRRGPAVALLLDAAHVHLRPREVADPVVGEPAHVERVERGGRRLLALAGVAEALASRGDLAVELGDAAPVREAQDVAASLAAVRSALTLRHLSPDRHAAVDARELG